MGASRFFRLLCYCWAMPNRMGAQCQWKCSLLLFSLISISFVCLQAQQKAENVAETKHKVNNVVDPAVKDFAGLIPHPSKRLVDLLANAKNHGATRVQISALPESQRRQYQALTECNRDNTECSTRIAPRCPNAYYEPLIAHELMHIVLNREGYPRESRSYRGLPITLLAVDNEIAGQLLAAVIHPVIDKRIRELKFDAAIPLAGELKSVTEDVERLHSAPELDEHASIGMAVHMYSLRLRGMNTSLIEASLRKGQPRVAAVEDKLRKIDDGTPCDSPDTCFDLLNNLRDAVVPKMNGYYEIYFMSPKTGLPRM